MTIVDAHHHVWRLADRPQSWIDPVRMARILRDFDERDLAAETAPLGVTSTVVVQTVHDEDETTELLALAARSPLITGVVGWADLTSPALADHLAKRREGEGGAHLVGLRHVVHDEPDPDWLDTPAVRRGLAVTAEAGLSFDLLVKTPNLASAARAAHDLPQLRLVLDHLAKPPFGSSAMPAWEAGVRALAAAPNVHAKLSGLVTEVDWELWTVADLRPAAEVALDAFGPDRLMFGSDWPVCLLAAPYQRVLDTAQHLLAGITDDQRGGVMSENARAFYRLGTVPPPAGPPAAEPSKEIHP